MISHSWFSSGSYTLLGHIHKPQNQPTRGVVIVPPFGWEDVCSYRPLRELAEILSAAGIAVLRYDLPATGDSTGHATDARLLDAWIASVDDAVSTLRSVIGVQSVSVLGVRMGAILALAAAASGAHITDLVLWGGAAQGRSFLRELRAFRNMEVPEFGETGTSLASTDGGIESGGFYLSPATVDALEKLDLTALPAIPGRRVLVLTRDEFASDKKLLAALQTSGAAMEELEGPGYAGMMAVPHEAQLNPEIATRIACWLNKGSAENARPATGNLPAQPRDQVALLPQPSGTSFGIITPASANNGLWLLFLNPGAGRHIGPNRLWVDLARDWAGRSVPSLRLDLAGIGESDGKQNLDVEGLYNEALVAQVHSAMEYLATHYGAKQFVLIGLCSGAFWAFHGAAHHAGVRAAILLNPRLFFWDPEVDRRRAKNRNVNAVGKPDAWKRLVRGQVPATRIRSAVRDVLGRLTTSESATEPTQIPAAAFHQTLNRIAASGAQLSLIFTEGEPLLNELEDEGHLGPDQGFRLQRIAGAGHTFRPLWAQARLREAIEAELSGILSAGKAT
jgi:alpha-beta hydrolase superfamily lysophospholipase